jgi:SpoVK/Ycf46/Vps4 family AAA+-type ATPase
VGEIRRILNSFLILVEQDSSESVILAATNHPELLDKALYRRFDDVIQFERPEQKQILELIESRLSSFDLKLFDWNVIAQKAEGLSSAEITRACDDAAKECVLHRDAIINTEIIIRAIERRQKIKR